MATQLQIRRGTTEQCDAFTGAEGEIIFDTTKKSLRLHDGSTAGGRHIPTFTGEIPSGGDYVVESQLPTSENNYTWYRLYNSGWVEQGGYVAAVSGNNSVTLPVAMNNAMYTAFFVSKSSSTLTYASSVPASATVLTFGATDAGMVNWEVKGVAGA